MLCCSYHCNAKDGSFVLIAVDTLLLCCFCSLLCLFFVLLILYIKVSVCKFKEPLFRLIGQFAGYHWDTSWKIWVFSRMWRNQMTSHPGKYEYPFVGLAKYTFYTSVKPFVSMASCATMTLKGSLSSCKWLTSSAIYIYMVLLSLSFSLMCNSTTFRMILWQIIYKAPFL